MTQRCFHCFKRVNVSAGIYADNVKRLRELGWRELKVLGVKRWFCELHAVEYAEPSGG